MKEYRSYLLALVTVTFFSPLLGAGKAASDTLSAPKNWRYISLPIFEDDVRNVRFYLRTSWINDPPRGGKLRFALTATPPPIEPDDPPEWRELYKSEARLKFLSRVHSCSFTLQLDDAGRFRLAEIPLVLHDGVDDEGKLIDLEENSSFPMSAQNYRSLLKGSFDIGWTC